MDASALEPRTLYSGVPLDGLVSDGSSEAHSATDQSWFSDAPWTDVHHERFEPKLSDLSNHHLLLNDVQLEIDFDVGRSLIESGSDAIEQAPQVFLWVDLSTLEEPGHRQPGAPQTGSPKVGLQESSEINTEMNATVPLLPSTEPADSIALLQIEDQERWATSDAETIDFESAASLLSKIDTVSLIAHLDRISTSLNETEYSSFSLVGATITTAAISLGYVIWTSRASYLAASSLAITPAWSQVDPLPILEFAEVDQDPNEGDRQVLDLVRLLDRVN